jgi:hypothetical protein
MSDVDQRLCRIAALAAAGEPLGAEGLWLADVLCRVRGGEPFDTAIGRAPGWQRSDAQRLCRRAMGKIADLVAPGGTDNERAAGIHAERRRYEPTWHRRDHRLSESPNADPASLEYWVFEMFRAAAVLRRTGRSNPIPESTKQITRILEEVSD